MSAEGLERDQPRPYTPLAHRAAPPAPRAAIHRHRPEIVQLSAERPSVRWLLLLLAWGLIAAIAAFDTFAVRDYVALLDASGAVPADSLPFVRSVPADYADAQTWVRYAVALDTSSSWQLRHTDIDNAPAGREVHWNSAYAHLILAAGRIERANTGATLSRATEQALAWFNLPLFLAVVIGFSAFVARRAGAAAGVLIAFGMVGHRWFYFGFSPNYVDHHGLLTAASFGVVLGAVFMGAGWWRDDEPPALLPASAGAARSAAFVSAVAGGIGLWISAASVLPMIAFVGLAGLASGWIFGRRAIAEGAEFDGALWRLWGRVGAAVSLVAYVIEYAPAHLGMRLEANHPLYALAWLGGGELVALLVERRIGRTIAPAWRLMLAIAAVAVAPIVILLGGPRVFVLADPRFSHLHASIGEFFSLPAIVHASGASALWRFAVGLVLILPALLVFRRGQKDRVLVGFAAIVVVAYVALACSQMRWWLEASGPELCMLLVAVAALTATQSERTRWVVVGCLSIFFAEQAIVRIADTRDDVRTQSASPADVMEPLFRDIAATIRSSQPTGDVVLLTNPNAATGISYFGGFRTLGTLYWENEEGIAAAASIFSATSDDEALRLIAAHRVTHIALLSRDDFLRAYFEFADPGAPADAITKTFGYRLFARGQVPRWLRPIPFRVRRGTPATVELLQVAPDQSEFDALWSQATARAAIGDFAGAETTFVRAIGIAPADRRGGLYETAAGVAYHWDAQAVALRLYRAAMTTTPTTTIAANIAWILATSADDAVRDGPAALALIEPLAKAHPNDPTVLDVYAASLAETGRTADAVAAVQRMQAIAERTGDAALSQRAAERLAVYSAGRAWRR